MKTLLKRLLGIERLENELIGMSAELEATNMALITERMLRRQLTTERDHIKGLLDERYETEWKVTKDGKRRYRRIATKVLVNAWRTESESLEDMEMVVPPSPEPVHEQLYCTDTVVTGYPEDDELAVM